MYHFRKFLILFQLPVPVKELSLECSSLNNAYMECSVEGVIIGVSVHKQHSSTECKMDSTFGYENGYVWVNSGCRAEFIVTMTVEQGTYILIISFKTYTISQIRSFSYILTMISMSEILTKQQSEFLNRFQQNRQKFSHFCQNLATPSVGFLTIL